MRRTLATLIFLTLLIGPAARSATPIPSRLADSELWGMVSTFSEPGGTFRFENFLSNEIYFQNVIPALKTRVKPGGIYMGVGPEQNFTYIVATQPKVAFITDIRRQNMLELMMYRALFEMAPDRADFISLLFSRKRPAGLAANATADALFTAYRSVVEDPSLYKKNLQAIEDLLLKTHKFPLSTQDLAGIEKVYGVFFDYGPDINYNSGSDGAGGGFGRGFAYVTYANLMSADDQQGAASTTAKNRSFLATEENYQYIRDMELRNMIVPLVGDFAGPKAIRAVGSWVKQHGATVTTFYLSNVEQYLFMDRVDGKFYANVETLPLDATSTFIRSGRPFDGGRNRGGRRGGGGGFGGLTSMFSPMTDVLKAYDAGRIRAWNDVLAMSR
ncbi:MAG TPA: hypothetical protein VFO86_04505 [Terriglobia bacterium]|nr:hypothetical protein [Terriglobia bacterium]